MIPSKIQRQLDALRSRERTLQFLSGAAQVAAVVMACIFVACLIDYLVDSYQETPWALRIVLLAGLLTATFVSSLFFFGPMLRRLHDEELALWVEESSPRLEHRLISAVQFNRQGADLQGMSAELVGVVTREADQHAERIAFTQVADHGRLKRGAMVLVPALVLLAVPVAVWPTLSMVLFGRLFLSGQPIERRVHLENLTKTVWPMGDKVLVRVGATGSRENEPGKLLVKQGLISDAYVMESKGRDPKSGETIYEAEVPPSTIDFAFNAYVGDGRLQESAAVQFKAKPVVTQIHAWTVLPRYCDPRPGHGPYLVEQPRGDAAGLPGSSIRVQATIPKYVEMVTLKLYGSSTGDPAKPADTLLRDFQMTLKSSKDKDANDKDSGTYIFEQTFDLREKETIYEIEAVDRYTFKNDPVPRRAVRQFAEVPPDVALLPERFPGKSGIVLPDDENLEVDGLPVPLGGPLLIAYTCSHPFGLGRANLKFRVIPKTRESEKSIDAKWQTLPLLEEKGSADQRFDPLRGTFSTGGGRDVPFHAVESLNPTQLGRTVGGGSFLFQTAKLLVDDAGKIRNPDKGDQIEFYIEVHPDLKAEQNSTFPRPVGRSTTRLKNIVSETEFGNWLTDQLSEERQISRLRSEQERLFNKKKN